MFGFLKREVKLVCFDMDDTLCDSKPAENESEVYLMELLAKDILDMQSKAKINAAKDRSSKGKKGAKTALTYNQCSAFSLLRIFNDVKKLRIRADSNPNGFSRASWIKETLERVDAEYDLGISLNTLMMDADSYERRYWNHFIEIVKIYPNTISALEQLKSWNISLAMLTDSDGKKGIKAERIKKMDLEKYFDHIIITDDTGKIKPAEENWEQLLKMSGLKSGQCMMVGDLPDVDLISAKKLGFTTVWTKEGFRNDVHLKYVDYEITDIQEIVRLVDKINR